jgi:hydroxyethylthiazole kinase-like uncharacterized protein yjeF
MQRILPNTSQLPLFTAASSRAIETQAQAGLPTHALMTRAGLAVARLALVLPKGEGAIWIVCGPGNNGGDGLVAARLLQMQGQSVHVSLIEGDRTPADALAARQAARQAGVSISNSLDAPAQVSLAVDALLGLGLQRPPAGVIAAAITRLNALAAPLLAVDLPSGLQSDSGAVFSLAGTRLAAQARHTLALLTLKPGQFTADGRALCGEQWFDDLGVSSSHMPDAELVGSSCLADWRAARSHSAHKGSQGNLLVVGGASGMRGAALLAARAALASGAGRVYCCLLGSQATELDAMRPELMLWPQARMSHPQDWRDMVIVCGCGGGEDTDAELPALLDQASRLIVDADGLNGVARDPQLRALLSRRSANGMQTILTPHPLEAARLLDCNALTVQQDRLAAARELAARYFCTIILKGSGSVIASADGRLSINSSGSAALATAGTGDVLAGWLGGLWAQQTATDPHQLAIAACHWHGLAAQDQPAGPLRAADLVERMHALFSA